MCIIKIAAGIFVKSLQVNIFTYLNEVLLIKLYLLVFHENTCIFTVIYTIALFIFISLGVRRNLIK